MKNNISNICQGCDQAATFQNISRPWCFSLALRRKCLSVFPARYKYINGLQGLQSSLQSDASDGSYLHLRQSPLIQTAWFVGEKDEQGFIHCSQIRLFFILLEYLSVALFR